MSKLYFGNGECELDGVDIMYCEMEVKYPIRIDDKSPPDFEIMVKDNIIKIAKFHRGNLSRLNKLFNYVGDLQVIKASTVSTNGDIVQCTLKRVMDYAELLGNAEDLTINSENMIASSLSGSLVSKMTLLQGTINNLQTADGGSYYLENGDIYTGYYHIHKEGGQLMTGRVHDRDSENLYFKEHYNGMSFDNLIKWNFVNMATTKYSRSKNQNIYKRTGVKNGVS